MATDLQKYYKYKPSGIKWIGQIPFEWHTRPIKFCVSIKVTDGPHETPVFVSDGVPFISAEAIKNNRIDFEKRRGNISKETDLIFSKKCKPQLDDVFLIKSGNTTGNAAIVETDIDFNIWSPLALMRVNKKVLLPKFLLYAIRSISFQDSVNLFCSIGTQPNIGMNIIENLKVCVPSIPEQTQIAHFLDEKTGQIDRLIAQKEKLLLLLAEKRTAIITQAVTKGLDPTVEMKDSGIDWLGEIPKHWEVVPLKYQLISLNRKRIPLSSEERGKMSKEYPYYGASGIIDYVEDFIFDEDLILIAEDGANLLSRSTPLAFVATGKYWVNNHAHILSSDPETFDYWSNLLCIIDYTPWITGAAQPKLTKENLGSIPLPKPPKKEQLEISDFINKEIKKFDPLIVKCKLSIAQLKEYREALITAAVTGQIDVREEKTGNENGTQRVPY
jgi:type I restriction enzyme S subunit